MDFQKCAAKLILGLVMLPCYSWSQTLPWVKALPRALGGSPMKQLASPVSIGIERAAWQARKKADIRLSVARLDHAVCLDLPPQKRPHSTAFLFQTTYKGRPEIWAASAGHTAQLGEPVRLTFYDGKKEIPVDGVVAQMGPALLSDAELIQLKTPLPKELQPFVLTDRITPQEKLVTWGYASNKLYRIEPLTCEKDNTRFIRTDFPSEQKKRSGLCGGPLLNSMGQVVGIHCGSSLEDKAYAASVRIIPYLLEAYHEGSVEIPLFIKDLFFGFIRIDERIVMLQCVDETNHLLKNVEVYDQLHQSDILALLREPDIRFIKLVLGSYEQEKPTYRVLVYDKITKTHTFEPLSHWTGLY